MQILTGHTQNKVKDRIEIDYGIEGQSFWVKAKLRGPFNLSDKFTKDGFENWELWNFDVLEIFLTKSATRVPYLELQISPLDQKLGLLIKKPRESFEFFTPKSFKFDTKLDRDLWEVNCEINTSDIPGDSSFLRGNLHCCLGPKNNRRFYGLKINQETVPDFHKPLNFISLGRFNEC